MAKTLTVYLAADVSKLNRGLNSAKGDLLGFEQGIGGLGGSLNNLLGPALIGAAAGAGALATKLAVDGVQAAIDDQAAHEKLATTLQNLGFPEAVSGVETWIDALQRSMGVSDDKLRPALDRLVRSTGNVSQAQDALRLALDISAGTGKDLESVSNALGKAYDGNTTALGKLGVGIDSAILKSGDMDQITAALATTFGGQAATAAETYKGKIERLKIGFDELKESFGYGFIDGLTTANNAMGVTADAVKNLEPAAKDAGGEIAGLGNNLAEGYVDFNNMWQAAANRDWGRVWQIFAWGSDSIAELGRQASWTAVQISRMAAGYSVMSSMASTSSKEQAKSAQASRYSALATQEYDQTLKYTGGTLQQWKTAQDEAAKSSRGGASAMRGVSDEADRLKKAYDAQNTVLEQSNSALTDAVGKWNNAKQAVTDYANNMSEKLLGGIDLGKAYQAQFDEAGKASGKSLIEAFNDQVAQAKWFANVLSEIKRQGADQSLIEQIASLGPETGGALGQQMIRDGLVRTINSQWTDVRSTIQTQAAGLVPDALLAGQDWAAGLVVGSAKQLLADEDKLRRMGKKIGQLVGSNVKDEIVSAVADALAAVEGSRSASSAQSAAAAAGQAAVVTQQSYVQTLNQVINNANNRTGYTTAQLYQMGVLH